MCKDCGCSLPRGDHHHDHDHHDGHHHHHDHIHANPQLNDPKTLAAITKILDANDKEAAGNREHFEEYGVLALNMMSSPGSGKTSLLEHTAQRLGLRFGVIEGDLETNRDAERIKSKGIPAVQIQTGTACHLDAHMVHHGLHELALADLDVVFIENVGNLVCPASYDIGSHYNVVLVSIPEGDDKIPKYPVMFRSADVVVITKCDLIPYFDFDIDRAKADIRRLAPKADILMVSTKDEASLDLWCEWIRMKKKMRG